MKNKVDIIRGVLFICRGFVGNDESLDASPHQLVHLPTRGVRHAGDHYWGTEQQRPTLLAGHKVLLHQELRGAGGRGGRERREGEAGGRGGTEKCENIYVNVHVSMSDEKEGRK